MTLSGPDPWVGAENREKKFKRNGGGSMKILVSMVIQHTHNLFNVVIVPRFIVRLSTIGHSAQTLRESKTITKS